MHFVHYNIDFGCQMKDEYDIINRWYLWNWTTKVQIHMSKKYSKNG